MKYYIFFTTLLTAILANIIYWYHPATFNIYTLSLLWFVCCIVAFLIITKKKVVNDIDPQRILHICLFYPPSTHKSASKIANFVAQTYNMSPKKDIRILTSNLDNNLSLINPHKLINDPIYIQRLHHLKIPFSKTPYLQALYYYISHHKPDCIYVHDNYWQLIITAQIYGMNNNIPVIINKELFNFH